MSVTLVSAVDPYPTDAGKKVVLAGFLEYFRDRLGPQDVHYLLVGGSPRSEFPVTLHPLPGPSRQAALTAVASRVPTGRATLQESLLYSPEVERAVQMTLERIGPDLEIYDTIRMAQYADGARADRQLCYLDDLFSERYTAMLDAADRYPDVTIRPLGNFAQHVPRRLRPLADSKLPQRALLRMEAALARRSEDRAALRFRRNLLVNDGEATRLAARVANRGSADVRAVPPLVKPPQYRQRRYEGAPDFVFIGLLSLPHNEDGVRSFLTDVWPTVLTRIPKARLRIIGRDCSPELTEAVGRFGGSVSLEGYVDDLTEVLCSAAGLINHLRFGSGIKLKVIEALGRGLPVISTSVGADGFATGGEHGVLVADRAAQFVEAMCELTDPGRNREISEAARGQFDSAYARDAVFACYDKAFSLR
ncbi:glycosyl transferase family 1 [Mycolicibacterium celeriflavum]|uniref:glycosyltransferase family 4 protein n=1 Tax=Mycolicibacterium celeriflavum TaxID=1249101 RepID=UPI0008016B53|nr:glycosyltransferase family 4 protein [Mycolicibacterium celeriflavum]OBG18574.1 glycosyl transferase family 1 [Mycolicibacterium celeriflavum]